MESQVAPSSLHGPLYFSIQEAHWFAAYTYPRHEKAVGELLGQKGIEAFVPTVHRLSQWKDRRVDLLVPLFPNYVFARICAGERAKVLSSPGVIRILSVRGVPVPVSDKEIEAVRVCIQRGGNLQKHCFLEVGDRVYVKRGVFEGLEGIVVRHNNGCKLIISISLIQQAIALEISADLLERVTPCTYTVSAESRSRCQII